MAGHRTTASSFLIMDDSSNEEIEPLTPLRIQFVDAFIYDVLMASSDVDQKFLGKFAQQTANIDPYFSQQLYKILGLSVLLSKKLFRARRLRRLDITRDTKSLQLYHHIIWLSREGLVILEVAVLPVVMTSRLNLPELAEMRVLAQKLQGSFYHIFVLFHNQPSINRAAAIPAAQSSSRRGPNRSDSIRRTIISDEEEDPYEQTAGRNQQLPPGLAPIAIPKPTASFLLPATDYIPNASTAFDRSMKLARELLGGSHPLRLSVAVEYCAYLYDCLHDGESSRSLAKATIRNVYSANDGMDDETFADSANLVSVLGKMMKRGLGSSAGTGSKTPSVANTGTTRSSPGRSHPQKQQQQSALNDFVRPLQPSHAHPQAYSQSSPRQGPRVPSSPRTGQQVPTDTSSHVLGDAYWAPNPSSPSQSRPRDRSRSPLQPHSGLPTATNTSPKSPRTKLPKMTPWEPPSPESARRKGPLTPVAKDSPPKIRGGGTTAGFVRANGLANGGSAVVNGNGKENGNGRTRTPEEVKAKEEKRKKVMLAEKKSRSSEGLKRRGSGSTEGRDVDKVKVRAKMGTSSTSREGLGEWEGLVNGTSEKNGRSRKRR